MEQIYYFIHEKSVSEYVVRIEKILDERTAELFIFKGKTPFGGRKTNELDPKATFDMNFFKEFATEIPQNKESLKLAFEFIFGREHA